MPHHCVQAFSSGTVRNVGAPLALLCVFKVAL